MYSATPTASSSFQNVTYANKFYDLSKVTHMTSMFANASHLQTVDMSGVATGTALQSMQAMFIGCADLTQALLPTGDGLVTSHVKYFNDMFKGCSSLAALNLVALDTDAVCQACKAMSNIKQGALIVLTRQNTLMDIVLTGVTIDAQISKPLIENIFFKNSPLHDGAMIITDNKIVAARCILPVTNNSEIPGHYGLRHRAAVGVSENNDCIVLVVSEETGTISLVKNGKITTLQPETLEETLDNELKN